MRQINLLPEEVKHTEIGRINKNVIIVGIGLIFLAMTLVHFSLVHRVTALKKTLKQLNAVKGYPGLGQLQKEAVAIEKEKARYASENKALIDIMAKHLASAPLLKSISDAAYGRVWFTALAVDPQKEGLRITGRAFNTELVSEFMLELKKMASFKKIDLASMEKQESADGEEINFAINCEFK
ncbi:MAG: PilN domain-containing protein [Candidatus Omnitrophica bacterium]|nr:PilN domain-containing protein [Candidatus Omnitrophota bacterium]